MTELDKFKRRTIRSVSRMLQQKKPPDELWAQMKKELGTDCRVLWERMRALCIKKLNRMLAVDDRSDSLPSVARLTLTDWLLVDLVLVHENIDVIAMEKEDNKAEQKPLVELFNLVQRFEVEGREGDELADAWAAATVFYNRQGRQCSPMLLQRRWYQLKKLTRCRFYRFWQSYRGNTRLLDGAKNTMPSRLQMAVAKRYPRVITQPFPDWEELIKQKLIVMPDKFEAKMRLPNLPKPSKSNGPDLVVVEPHIETIDLRVDSDPEDESKDNDVDTSDTSDPEKSNDAPPQVEDKGLSGVKIKTEPIEEDGLSNVQLIAATHVPEVDIRDDDNPEPIVQHNEPIQIKKEEKQNDSPNDDDVIEIPNDIPVVDVDLDSPTNNVTEKPQEEVLVTSCPDNVLNDDADVDEIVDDFIKIKADEFCSKEAKVDESIKTNEESLVDSIIKDKLDNFLNTPKDVSGEINPNVNAINFISEKTDLTAMDLIADLNFVDDGIEFVDDGIEFVEDDDDDVPNKEPVNKSPTNENSNEDSGNKFDLKLLMDPVVYTTKLDHMRIFSGIKYDSVETKEVIDKVVAESKPVSKKSFNINIKQEDGTSQTDNEAAADDSGPIDDLFTNQDEYSDDDLPDNTRVSITSNMLRKPKTRSYNPIQLCKNPDFNTKLRRLNIGFFSSIRNRQLLKSCIPVTIDVSKSFESKMLDGTLYLKRTSCTVKIEPEEVVNTVEPTVVPITMPVQQSPLDKVLTNIPSLPPPAITTTPDPVVSERKKISLPDIEKVRKINQQLLTAQVPPIRVYAGESHQLPPVIAPTIVEATSLADQVKSTDECKSTPPPEPLNDLPTVVKVKSEANLDSKIDPPPEIPPELPPAKKKLIKIINRAKVLTQEALSKIDGGIKASVDNEIKQFDLAREVIKKPKRPDIKNPTIQWVPVPWTKRVFAQRPEQIDDFLITSDTLNKMLHLMGRDTHDTDCNSCVSKPKKKKKKIKKPVENADELVIARGRVFRYCCWARQKIANRKRLTKHTCPPGNCTCCCRDELAEKQNQEKGTSDAIELSDDEDLSLQKACESIENVVQQSRELTRAVVIENVPTIEVVDQALAVAANETVSASHGGSPVLVTPVSRALDASTHEIKENLATVQTPFELPPSEPVTVTAGQALIKDISIQPLRVTAEPPALKVRSPQELMKVVPSSDSVSQTSPSLIHNVRTKIVKGIPKRKPASNPNISPPACVLCSCKKPAVGLGMQRNIVIDASKQCPLHFHVPPAPIPVKTISTSITSPKNDKVVYLNSKSMAKSPSESPIFLGKNKILLTTVKFPRRDVVPDREVFQVPKIIPTWEMPAGVHLIMLASGCVTYTLDPGRVLSEAELASLPSIIAAVQEQLNMYPPMIDINNPNINSTVLAPLVNVNSQTTEQQVPINLDADEVCQDVESQKLPDNVDAVPIVSMPVEDAVPSETQPAVDTSHSSGKENECLPSNKVVENTTNETNIPKVSNDTTPQENTSTESKPASGFETQAEKDTQEVNDKDDKVPPENVENGKEAKDTIEVNREAIDNVEASKEVTGNLKASKEATDTIEVNQKATDNVEASKDVTGNLEVSKEATDTIEVNKDATDNVEPSKEATGNVEICKETTDNVQDNKKVTDNVEASKEVTGNVEGRKEATDNVEDSKEATNNVEPSKGATGNVETYKATTDNVQDNKKVTDNVEVSKETIEEKNGSAAKEPTSNRKSLLSDLMEMSGISAEDTTAVEPPPLVQLIPENIISNIALGVSGELVGGPVLGANAVLTAEQTRSLPELSPVTSFAELKYACEQKGKFFKLDYETGVIVPINVCIKKNVKRQIQQNPKVVIDLTEDVDNEDTTEINTTSESASQTSAQYIYNGKTVEVAVKPVKMFKTCHAPLLKRRKLFDKTAVEVTVKKKSHMENRKQALHRLEAKIDLVDSDEPMEEEYLMDSSDDEPLSAMEPMQIETLDLGILENSDDSSDDEPLAKKSKRLKEVQPEKIDDDNIETNIRLAMDCLDDNMSAPEAGPAVSEDANKDSDTHVPMIYEDLPSSSKEGDPVIRFMSDASDAEGGDDDCILGV